MKLNILFPFSFNTENERMKKSCTNVQDDDDCVRFKWFELLHMAMKYNINGLKFLLTLKEREI